MSRYIKIAIDGPAAAGKSTIAKMVAVELGYTYIDTGAMYRALTHKALVNNININDEEKLENLLRKTSIDLLPMKDKQVVFVDGENVTDAIRSLEVTANVSAVATHTGVRHMMVEKQRQLSDGIGVVMDGRDIGTAVLPDAELKIFMTASVEERAQRRFIENEKRGIITTVEDLQNEISERDRADSEREISPLRQAEDAIRIDTTSMSIEEVAKMISDLAEKRKNQ